MMEEASSAAREVMAAGSPEEKAAKQTEIVKDAFQRAVVNMRELAELVAKSQTDAMEVVQQRVAESLDEIKTVIAKKK
jgi:phasin family protein